MDWPGNWFRSRRGQQDSPGSRAVCLADYAAVLDGRNLQLCGAVSGIDEAERRDVAIALVDHESNVEVSRSEAFVRSEAGRTQFDASVPLDHDFEPPTATKRYRVQALIGGSDGSPPVVTPVLAVCPPLAEEGPTVANPPSPSTGKSYTLRLKRNRPIYVRGRPEGPQAVVESVHVGLVGITVRCRIVGAVDLVSLERVTAQVSASDRPSVRVGCETLVDGASLVVDLPTEILARSSSGNRVWDLVLTGGHSKPMRPAAASNDLKEPGAAYSFPYLLVTTDRGAWRILPSYTASRTLSFEVFDLTAKDQ